MTQAKALNSASAGKEIALADFVPFRSHISNYVVTGEGGSYMRIWKLDGISFEAADIDDINNKHDSFNQFLRSISAEKPGTAVWAHKVRRKVTDRFKAKFPNEYCQSFNERYFDSFAGYRMMANELYLTVVYQPNFDALGLTKMWRSAKGMSPEQIEQNQKDAIQYLDTVAYQLESAMKSYGPEPLGIYEASIESEGPTGQIKPQTVLCSRALEFFGFLLNGFWERVPLRRSRINEYLPTSRLFFGNENIEIRTPTDTRFASILDFSDYPQESEPGILNTILYDDYEYIETQSFSMLSKYEALAALKRQRNQLVASEDAAFSQIRAIDRAIEEVVNGTFVMGDYHYSLAVFGSNLQEVAKNTQRTRTALNDQGFQTKVVDLVPDAAWFSQLPANWKYRPREAQLSSRAFCGLSAFHNFASGKRDGNPWGEAVTILKTPSGQPYYMNFHSTDEDENSEDKKALGNVMIIGQAGSGKTVTKLAMLVQATKFDPTMILFDKDRGEEIAVRAMGGKYFALKRGELTGFNPFKLEPTKKNTDFWIALIKQLVKHSTAPLTPVDEAMITHAVMTVADFGVDLRGITAIRQNLPDDTENSLSMRLNKWCHGQELGWVLDCPRDLQDFTTHKIYGYDYTEFLDDPETRTPIMMYLMHLTESQIDGRRFIYGMAEFWKPLGDPVFMDFVKNKQKTIRKQNGLGIFDTQSPSDALESPIARALIEQCATFIFLANPKATREDYVNGFKLSDAEYDIVQHLGENSRTFLIKQGHQSAIAKLDLAGFDDDLDILSGSTDNVELLDQIRLELGSDEPADWMPVLRERIALRRSLGKRTKPKLNAVMA